MKARAYFERLPLCRHGIVRVYTDESVPFGMPYDIAFTAVVSGWTPPEADARGLRADGFKKAHLDAVKDCLRAEGFGALTWDRFKPLPGGGFAKRHIRIEL